MFLANKLNKGAGSPAAPADAQFNYVTMLLHGDGTNGAQNNTFLDSSTNNFTITRNGNTTQGSFSPYGSNWSNSFNGTSSYLTLSSNASMSFGTSNFTIEGWFFTGDKSVSGGASRTLIGNSGNSYTEQLYISTSGYLTFGNTGSTYIQGSTDLANNTWHHFAVSRSGTSTNQIAMWVDGTRVAQGTNSQNYTSGTIYIGAFGTTDGFWNGYISNLRIVNGSAVYDPANSTITVPTTPLTAITNTALLTCQANRFIDASANAYTVTATGSPSVQRFNPFGASTAYSTSVIGGSGYFDGSGDYLETPTSSAFAFGTGDFTSELWVYLSRSNGTIIYEPRTSSNESNPCIAYGVVAANKFEVANSAIIITSSSTFGINQWHHVALVRSGTTLTLWVNGTNQGSTTLSTNLTNNDRIRIGEYFTAGTYALQGYVSNLRVVKGTAVYTSAFTPSTTPLTAISGTSLLTSMTNGAIFDNAMMNDLETVGNAQISTSVKKYGTGSLAFDGTGDGLFARSTPDSAFGTGDFTVEFWINLAANLGSFVKIVQMGTTGNCFTIETQSTTNVLNITNFTSTVYLASSTALTTSTWIHVAVTRASGTLRIFQNGTQTGSVANTVDFPNAGGLYIGQSSTGQAMNGYIDDLRITKGYARYTANFTPPTAAFPNTGPV